MDSKQSRRRKIVAAAWLWAVIAAFLITNFLLKAKYWSALAGLLGA